MLPGDQSTLHVSRTNVAFERCAEKHTDTQKDASESDFNACSPHSHRSRPNRDGFIHWKHTS